MRAVHSCDTTPELAVRKLLRYLGFTSYRLHRKDLPGKPDVVFVGQRKAIFVHGCFWHGHNCPRGARVPSTNTTYWLSKIARNQHRDVDNQAKLIQLGWSVLIIWECELKNPSMLSANILQFLSKK